MPSLRNAIWLTVLASLKSCIALALPEAEWEVVDRPNLLPRDAFDVSKYASLGESYASGPSAGDSYDDTPCRRYKKAFGPQVSEDDRIQGPKPIDFSFIACSGSRTRAIYENNPDWKIKESQASQLKDKNPEMVTLSIGGNDVGFVKIMDRCVYRFYQSSLNACRGCAFFFFDDCTNDCKAAMDEVQDSIDGQGFADGLSSAIKSIFEFAPRTKLFITGYPRFWNDKTDYCDDVSFKLYCPNNYVLPLTKERRAGMNTLSNNLNDKIKTIIDNYPTRADMHFVDTNPGFEGHRFCEEGVKEPSYRNPNIYFYPLEYTTGGLSVEFDGKGENVPHGDCEAILENGDQGDYFTCLMANGVLENDTSINLGEFPNNVPGDDEAAITSGDGVPDWIARVFHPTINGMTAYRDAIVQAYNDYTPRDDPDFERGTCQINISQSAELNTSTTIEWGWKSSYSDNAGMAIEGCVTDEKVQVSTEDFSSLCYQLGIPVIIHDAGEGKLEFTYGDQKWSSDDTDACDVTDFRDVGGVPTRGLGCRFKCG